MNLRGLVGNAHLQPQLKGALTHAYLISGPQANARRALSAIMARSLVCRSPGERPCNGCAPCEKAAKGFHPDILRTAPGETGAKREILVSEVRRITADIHTLPNEAAHKVYIVEDADSLNANAQNAFLKALEEPPAFVTFLLLAENPLALLPTLRSRCTHLALVPAEDGAAADEGAHMPLVEAFFKAFSSGGLPLLQFCVELEKTDKKILEAFVEACHSRLVDALGREKTREKQLMLAIDLFDSLRNDLRFHVSPGHISGKIAATLLL